MNSAHSFTEGADVPTPVFGDLTQPPHVPTCVSTGEGVTVPTPAPTVDEDIARQAKAGTLTQAMNPAPTPRTDRVEARVWGRYKQAEDITPEDNAREALGEACNHARTLERELQAATARVTELERQLAEAGDLCKHGIPLYAYGDNEAACELANRIEQIFDRLDAARAEREGAKQ